MTADVVGARRTVRPRHLRMGAAALALALVASAGLVPAAMPTEAATGASAINWASDPGDPIGQGQDGVLTDAAATFEMYSSGSNLAVVHAVDAANHLWSLLFSSGSTDLVAGTYEAKGLGGGPFMWAQGPSMAGNCDMRGSFTVLDVVHTGELGVVSSLAIRMSGHCDVYPGTFSADVRFQTSTGYALAGAPTTGTFPGVPHGTTRTHEVTLPSIGSGSLAVSAIALTGATPERFVIQGETCTAAPVAGGASCSVTLATTADTWSGASATLRFTTDGLRPIVDLAVSADVVLPLQASPASIDFGSVPIGEPAALSSVTVSNIGSSPVTLGTAQVGGPEPWAYGITADTCSGSALGGGATCSLTVAFEPFGDSPGHATLMLPVTGTGWSYDPSLGIDLVGVGGYRAAAISPSSIHGAGPVGTSNGGGALGRTVAASGGSYLHALSVSRTSGTTTVKDRGPYMPVLYTRGTSGGASWTSGKRLNATNQHGVWPGLAASGAYVYATWVRVPRVVSWSTSGARAIWFRANGAHGAGTWRTATPLTSSTGRVDYPSIAASGANVFIAYTDANTGSVKLLVSRNRGGTWKRLTLGTTSLASGLGGRTGLPSVAASGSTVIVAWIADGRGTIKARISSNGGVTFRSTSTVAGGSRSYPSVAALGGRAGVAWIGTEPSVATWTAAGGWTTEYQVPNVNHVWLEDLFEPALLLVGAHGVGVGFSGCVQLCDVYRSGSHLESYYAESPTDGRSWYNGAPIGVAVSSDGRAGADGLSIVATSPTRREFTFTWWTPGSTWRRLAHRSLTVTPQPVGGATTRPETLDAALVPSMEDPTTPASRMTPWPGSVDRR